MTLDLYQIDAFTDTLFGGNPAAVCPLNEWLSDELMQKIAAENNLSETAFFILKEDHYEIRWFTPKVEVDLCGHATLAAAYVIFKQLNRNTSRLLFESKSGKLKVTKAGNYLTLDFPIIPIVRCDSDERFNQALGMAPIEVWKGIDYLCVLKNEEQIRQCNPRFDIIEKLDSRGLAITAPGNKADFVSRWFGPQVGVNEDPVTGSAHCMLAPYWATRLNKTQLDAEQLSYRAGKIHCQVKEDKVFLTGQAILYLQGKIGIPKFTP